MCSAPFLRALVVRAHQTKVEFSLNISQNISKYVGTGQRKATGQEASFDFCFNFFQSFRNENNIECAFEVYSIRHTFLTRLGESGCDAWTLARIAGHSNNSISQRYVHPSEDAVLHALSRLGGHNSGHNDENEIPVGSGELFLNTTNRES